MITSGTVSIEDGKKGREDFAPPRKVKVELSFSVEEGGDALKELDGVTTIAGDRVRDMLGVAQRAFAGPVIQEGVTKASEGDVAAPAASGAMASAGWDAVAKGMIAFMPSQQTIEDLNGYYKSNRPLLDEMKGKSPNDHAAIMAAFTKRKEELSKGDDL